MDPNLEPVKQTVDKLIDAVGAVGEEVGHEEEEDAHFANYTSPAGLLYDLNDYGELDFEETYPSYETAEGEMSELGDLVDLEGSDLEYLMKPEELVDHPSSNLQENIAELRGKIESIELATSQLFSVIDYLAKDGEIVMKLNELDPFPLTNEKGALRQMIWTLEKRICSLEKEQDRPGGDSADEDDVPELTRTRKKRLRSNTILDTLLEPKITNSLLQSVYGDKTNGDIVQLIKSDLKDMTEQIGKWHGTNTSVTETLKQLKGRIPSEALCACVGQVAVMKRAINIMTGGRYNSGEDIIFLNPNRVGDLETKLANTGERLKNLEEVVKQMGDFDKQMKKLRKKFAPYIRSILYDEPLPGENEQVDIGLDALHNRIQVIMEDMKTITTISDQLLKSQHERDNRLANIRLEIERLRAVKADKEDVEDVLTEKADPSDSNRRIYGDDFFTLLKRIASFNNNCAMDLADKEVVWRRTIGEIRNESEMKANKIDLEDAKQRFKEEIEYLIGKLREIRMKFTPRPEMDKQLDNVICISCGAEIKAEATFGTSPDKRKSEFTWPLKGKGKTHSSIDKSPVLTKYGKRVSNRFTGSSHTITTPEQRLDRPVRPDCEECRHPSIKETSEVTANIEDGINIRKQMEENQKQKEAENKKGAKKQKEPENKSGAEKQK